MRWQDWLAMMMLASFFALCVYLDLRFMAVSHGTILALLAWARVS